MCFRYLYVFDLLSLFWQILGDFIVSLSISFRCKLSFRSLKADRLQKKKKTQIKSLQGTQTFGNSDRDTCACFLMLSHGVLPWLQLSNQPSASSEHHVMMQRLLLKLDEMPLGSERCWREDSNTGYKCKQSSRISTELVVGTILSNQRKGINYDHSGLQSSWQGQQKWFSHWSNLKLWDIPTEYKEDDKYWHWDQLKRAPY